MAEKNSQNRPVGYAHISTYGQTLDAQGTGEELQRRTSDDCEARGRLRRVLQKIRGSIVHRTSRRRFDEGNLWHHVLIGIFQHRDKGLFPALSDQYVMRQKVYKFLQRSDDFRTIDLTWELAL